MTRRTGTVAELIHGRYVAPRRARVLSRHLAPLIPAQSHVLDIGCGDGTLSALIAQERPDLRMEGVEVLARPGSRIPVRVFNGVVLPYREASIDVALLVDALHHTEDPMVLLREARRVARQALVIKDHLLQGFLAGPTLRLMDDVGNARFHVALPHTYWPKARWLEAFAQLGLSVGAWLETLGLYPWPATWLFDRSLHFVARLDVAPPRTQDPSGIVQASQSS